MNRWFLYTGDLAYLDMTVNSPCPAGYNFGSFKVIDTLNFTWNDVAFLAIL